MVLNLFYNGNKCLVNQGKKAGICLSIHISSFSGEDDLYGGRVIVMNEQFEQNMLLLCRGYDTAEDSQMLVMQLH